MADASTLIAELERRGFQPFASLGAVAEHVTAAYARRPGIGELHELVLVVDRTGLDPGPSLEGSPHRTNARRGPFVVPVHEVVAVAKGLPTSFLSPLSRVTIVELASGPLGDDDRRRIDQYVTLDGTTMLDAIRVDVDASTAYATDSASPRRTGLARSGDPAAWIAEALGATLVRDHRDEGQAPRLFASRAVAVATFFLSPIAGAALLGWNLHRTRRSSLAIALLATCALVLAFFVSLLPRLATFPLTLASIYWLSRTTRGMFGSPLRRASALLAIGLGLAGLLVYGTMVGVIIAVTGIDR